jgi:hypothetical protein
MEAYAEPSRAGNERVWYFPAKNETAPRLEPGPEQDVLRIGVLLGPEHAPGHYRIHVVLSEQPLDREKTLEASPVATLRVETIDLEVVAP